MMSLQSDRVAFVSGSKYLIYGLVDPQTLMVRYVGKSNRGMSRPKDHGMPSQLGREKSHKANWIRSLHAAGCGYAIAVLQESQPESIDSDERWWIAYGRASGWPLTNLTDGGEGAPGHIKSEEVRAQISARASGNSYAKGYRHTEEARAKIAAASKGRICSDETREVLRAANTGKVVSEETRGKLRASNAWIDLSPTIRINLKSALDYRHTEETRAKMSAFQRSRGPLDPNVARKIGDALRGRKREQATVERVRAALLARSESDIAASTAQGWNARRERCVETGAPLNGRERPKTCPHGHAYTPENSRIDRRGRMSCITCSRKRRMQYYYAKKASHA